MVEQGGNNPDGTGIVFDAAGLPNTAPSARDCQKSRAAQVSQDEEGGRASGGRGVSANTCAQLGTHPWPTRTLRPNSNSTASSSKNCSSALRRRSVLDDEKIQSPKFVYDVKALRDNARIIVQRGALLRKADFRSPSGKLKLLGPDLDRIIPLQRAGELSFRLEEEVIGSSAEQKMADGDEGGDSDADRRTRNTSSAEDSE
ncbi:BZ3500_MvSof-1268-A1-R1_Chr1-3g02194 [Microbotryum saponariae]|uniref:BZ3500_MvSof-1268-A1-R1_Chr1-3g02194 protein n=1 Tax=Microbotryum saponariae TaxID=289078 RepID=A0A2X0KWN7_9BASI|nr:BZ3500_MvSof-1268-A1-R1_Chr1-3g02194 [Microbotryum saponariae]SCZ95620.1 BZ3501_MvSof-1269-A2-R1_Chr1-3g01797 [Microbotryum saponariae]